MREPVSRGYRHVVRQARLQAEAEERGALTNATQALWLIGLIERHDLEFLRCGGRLEVWSRSCRRGHEGATLIEALTEAANCQRCTGREK